MDPGAKPQQEVPGRRFTAPKLPGRRRNGVTAHGCWGTPLSAEIPTGLAGLHCDSRLASLPEYTQGRITHRQLESRRTDGAKSCCQTVPDKRHYKSYYVSLYSHLPFFSSIHLCFAPPFRSMAYSGLPRQRSARRRAETSERKSHIYYAKRRERHLASGPTLPQYAPNTNISAASLRGKWNRYVLIT
jgi:hypothetical protein